MIKERIPNIAEWDYEKVRIYTDEYDKQMGWNNFICVFPKELEQDSWTATRLAQQIMWKFSALDGHTDCRYFNGEHDFDVEDLDEYGTNWVVFLEDLGS